MDEKVTLRERIWRHLRERGPQNVVEITDALGLPVKTGVSSPHRCASDAVLDLTQDGFLRKEGSGKYPKYRAIGGKAPVDKRTLRSSRKANVQRVSGKLGRHPKPAPATAIEAAWGWMPKMISDAD